MGKAVENVFPFAELLDGQPVIFLVQEKSRLLAVFYIHKVAYSILDDFHAGIKGLSNKSLIPFHSLLQADLGVTAFIDSADGYGVLQQNLFQFFQNDRFPSVDTKSQ